MQNFWGANKAHHAKCASGVLPKRRLRLLNSVDFTIFKLTLSNYAAQGFQSLLFKQPHEDISTLLNQKTGPGLVC